MALITCLDTPQLIDVDKLVDFAKQAAENGYIDPTSSLADSRVFLISGTKDTTVPQSTYIAAVSLQKLSISLGAMDKLYDFYSAFVSDGNLGKNFTIPAQHAQVCMWGVTASDL